MTRITHDQRRVAERNGRGGCRASAQSPRRAYVAGAVRLRERTTNAAVEGEWKDFLRLQEASKASWVCDEGQEPSSARVRRLVRHQEAVLKPQAPSIQRLRRAWHCGAPEMGDELSGVSRRHGEAPIVASRDRSHRQWPRLRTRKLSLGYRLRKRIQQAQQRSLDPRRPNANDGAMVARDWNHGKAVALSRQTRVVALRCADQAAEGVATTGGVG